MLISVLDHIPDDPDLRAQWNALALQARAPQVFYTWEWAAAVERAYSATLRPILFLGHDDGGRLCGVAALASDPEGRASFLCATTGDYCDFIVSEKDSAAFTTEVISKLRQSGYRDIVLTNFPEDSPSFAAVNEATRRAGLRMYARTAYVCAQIRLADLRASDVSGLALPRQKMVRRSLRAMGGATTPEITSDSTWERAGVLLPEFFRAHVARFLFTERISNLVRPERREFLLELAHLLSATGWLCFTRMTAGPRAVAWNYGFKFCGTSFWYQPTFVNDLEKYSPGFVLLSKLIEDSAKDAAIEAVDLGLGAEPYKEAFANASRRTLNVTLHQSLARHWKEMVRYRAATAIAGWPWAEREARNLRAKVDALKRRVREDGVKSTLKRLWSRIRDRIFLREEVFFYELSSPDLAKPDLAKPDAAKPEVSKSDLANPTRSNSEPSNPNRGLPHTNGVFLQTISLETLADAAMQNPEDEGTLAYLLRCARRLRTEPNSTGYALTNPAGELLHFTWAGPFESFYWSELDSKLPSPAPGAVVLFDSWTPVSQRGRGHYAPTLGLVVARIREEGKRCWGFSASMNTSSVRGLEKAGFRRCFSVFRYRVLWWQKIVQRNVPPSGSSMSGTSRSGTSTSGTS